MGHYLECKSFIHCSFEGCAGNRGAKFDTQNSPIRHLHISHNAPYLPPTILHNLCFSFLLGITAVPREIENNAYAKFWGANKVHYGRCESGEFLDLLQVDLTSFLASGASFISREAAKRAADEGLFWKSMQFHTTSTQATWQKGTVTATRTEKKKIGSGLGQTSNFSWDEPNFVR